MNAPTLSSSYDYQRKAFRVYEGGGAPMDGWKRQILPRAPVSTYPLGTPIHEALPKAQGTFRGYSPVPQGTLQADPSEGLGSVAVPSDPRKETISLRQEELREINVAVGLAAGALGFLLGRMGGPVPLVAFAAVASFTLGAEVRNGSKG